MAGNKGKYIVDASVIIKWFFQNEAFADMALAIRNDFLFKKVSLLVPAHSFFEVMNSISIKSPGRASLFLSQLFILNMFECKLTVAQTAMSVSIMNDFPKVSFYDAVYHALAIETQGIFITADEKYYEKTKSLKHIQLLNDYKPA